MGHCIHPGGVGSTCGPLMVVGTLCPIYLISKRHDDQGPWYALIIHPQQRHTSNRQIGTNKFTTACGSRKNENHIARGRLRCMSKVTFKLYAFQFKALNYLTVSLRGRKQRQTQSVSHWVTVRIALLVALGDTAPFKKNEYCFWMNILDFKKMNIVFEWIFWILKIWIFCSNEYSGF